MENLFKIHISRSRIFGLDILRALAISFVVVGHGSDFFADNSSVKNLLTYTIFDGVNLFFVLSGFLIGEILIKKLLYFPISFSELIKFWNRRWFRTVPAYFLVLTLAVILASFNQVYIITPHVERFYFFSQNLFSLHPNFYNEAWSLSIEEWFYIILPIILFSLGKIFGQHKQLIIVAAVIIILAVTLLRVYSYVIYPGQPSLQWDTLFRKMVYLRLDSLMYGVVGAYLNFFYQPSWVKFKYLSFVAGIVLLLADKAFFTEMKSPLDTLYACAFSFSVSSLGTLLLLPFLSQIKTGKGLLYKAISYIAAISYSMYLINFSVVLKFIMPMLDITGLSGFAGFIVLTILISILMFKYIELPITSLRAKDNSYTA